MRSYESFCRLVMNSSADDATGLDSSGMGSPKRKSSKKTTVAKQQQLVVKSIVGPNDRVDATPLALNVPDAAATNSAARPLPPQPAPDPAAPDPTAMLRLVQEVVARDQDHATNIFEVRSVVVSVRFQCLHQSHIDCAWRWQNFDLPRSGSVGASYTSITAPSLHHRSIRAMPYHRHGLRACVLACLRAYRMHASQATLISGERWLSWASR